jgi:hypothetical protein
LSYAKKVDASDNLKQSQIINPVNSDQSKDTKVTTKISESHRVGAELEQRRSRGGAVLEQSWSSVVTVFS